MQWTAVRVQSMDIQLSSHVSRASILRVPFIAPKIESESTLQLHHHNHLIARVSYLSVSRSCHSNSEPIKYEWNAVEILIYFWLTLQEIQTAHKTVAQW